MSKALITGVSGQVGSYLADYLLKMGYTVHGLNRRKSVENLDNIKHTLENPNFLIVEGDITDAHSINKIVDRGKYDEIYNLCAQSHVAVSFNQPAETFQVNTVGVLYLLDAIQWYSHTTKFYQASTSELFGSSKPPQNEETYFKPQSPYACAKLSSHWMVGIYRSSYDLKASSGLMFNSESPKRGKTFVTKKITEWIKSYKNNSNIKPLQLGNLSAKRDWSHTLDSVDAIYRICNQDKFRKDWDEKTSKYKDYCFGSGESNSIRYFLTRALQLGFNLDMFSNRFEFQGHGLEECVMDKETGKKIVEVFGAFFRPAEVDYLLCDSTKIKSELGWEPKYNLDYIIKDMLGE